MELHTFSNKKERINALRGKKVINFHSDAKLDYYRLKSSTAIKEANCQKSKGRLATFMPALEEGLRDISS